MTNITPITVAYGDGVGPEMMEACLHIIREAGANISIESIEVGQRIYKQGAKDGILPSAFPLLMRTGVLLLGPITIPTHEKCEPLSQSLSERFDLTYSQAFEQRLTSTQTENKTATAFGLQTTGETFALFTSTDTAANKHAGKGKANPSAMLQACILMLEHIGQQEVAERIHSAWVKTLEAGIHTPDMYGKQSTQKVSTEEFAEAVVERL